MDGQVFRITIPQPTLFGGITTFAPRSWPVSASSILTLHASDTDVTAHAVSASSILSMHPAASEVGEHAVAATSTITFTPFAPQHFNAVATSTLTLHGADTGGLEIPAASSDLFTFAAQAAENAAVVPSGSDTLTLTIHTHYTPYGMAADTITFGFGLYDGSGGLSGGPNSERGQAVSAVVRPSDAASTLDLHVAAVHESVHLVSASSTLTLTGTDVGAQDEPDVAASTLTLHGVASGVPARTAIASSTLTFTAAASQVALSDSPASSELDLHGVGSSTLKAVSAGSDTILFHSPPALAATDATVFSTLTFTEIAACSIDFGRFRRGDRVPILFGTEARPDFAPVMVVLDPSNTQVAALPIPAMDQSRETFGYPLFVDQNFSLGIFKVYAHYTVNGVAFLDSGTFTVVPGGDSGGQVISLFSVDRPEARSVVAQISKGRIVIGSNPAIS